MRVGLVRRVGISLVAVFALGIAGCDDNPIDFDATEATQIFTNPSAMTVPAGVTAFLESRTLNEGGQPTWDEITPAVDGTCGSATLTVEVADDYEPEVQPPGVFDVTGGTTLGETCIQLSGGGVDATVEVTVVGDSLAVVNAPDTLNINASVQLSAALLADDGTPVAPFDPATDIAWSSDNEAALTVDADGLVTAVGIGAAIITATWTDFGVTRTATATITVNAPTLEILGAPDTLVIFQMADLDADLINPTDPPADFGPFDQTNVTWETSNDAILTIDPATGVIEGVGPGEATITATWTGNATVIAEVDIFVDVPAPVLLSAVPTSADPQATVTLTGTGFIDGGHSIFVDGDIVPDALNPTIVGPTTATLDMCAGAVGDVDVTVGTAFAPSNALTITRTSEMVEPDGPTAANPICGTSLTIENGSLDHDTDTNDWFLVEVEGDPTITIQLTWPDDTQDLDILVTDGAFTAFVCTDGATGAPHGSETSSCHLPATGSYLIWIDHFDPVGASTDYTLTVIGP